MTIAADVRRFGKWGGPTAGVSVTLFAISAALIFFIAYAGVSMNRAALENERGLVNAALTETVNRTLMEQKGIVFWDDAAVAAQGPRFDADWFDAEVGAFFTEGYGHEQVYVLDPDDRVVYGYAHGKRTGGARLERLRPTLAPMLAQIRTGMPRAYVRRDSLFGLNQQRYNKLGGARSGRWASNILYDDKGPIIVSAMTIVPTIDAGLLLPRPYLIVSVVRLDQEAVGLIGQSLRLEGLALTPLAPGDSAVVPLVADDGTARVGLRWAVATPGKMMLTRILPAFAVLLLIATFYSRSMLRRLHEAYAKLRDQEASARFLALHDSLSQLPNRRHFVQALRGKLDALEPGSGQRLCVAYVDVDRFKDVNDVIGHGAGDALIMQIGPRLQGLLRPDDFLARLGGDEFAILRMLDGDDSPERLGETILAAFKRPFELGAGQIEVTASVGISIAHPGENDAERIVQDADISLYRAKDLGRRRYTIFEASMAEEVRTRHEMEVDLRAAIGTEQIVMHYQPVVSTRSGKVTSVEALVRWQHPKRGLVPPNRFISIAEQSGLMVPLGDHILEMVFRDAQRFSEDVDIAVNLSPVQIRQRNLPDRLAQLARLFAVDPARIVLEVTESMLLEATGPAADNLQTLRDFGFRTALDDFGTGYSSLGYLHRFEFDKIKIDRSFVSSGSLEKLRPVIEAIVHIGRGLRMAIVAEGVESAAELAMVQALGCTEAQGYWISKPVPLQQVLDFIALPPEGLGRSATLTLAREKGAA